MAGVAKRKGAESGEIKHLADSRERNQGVKERRVSAAQLWLTAKEEGVGGIELGGGAWRRGARDASQVFDVDHCRPNI